MVSLRRRKLLGLCAGKGSFLPPVPKFSENGTASDISFQCTTFVSICSDDANKIKGNSIVNTSPEPSIVSDSSASIELNNESIVEAPVKRRKRHRRKHFEDQEPCLMRGVYFKNMKWQAAIKVDKKQIHLGTVPSQEEAAHLYDRAAFMCGREPNFELSEEEKQELRKFNWDEFLAMTRHAITNKKQKRSSQELKNFERSSPLKDSWEERYEFVDISGVEDVEIEASAS